MFRGSIHLIRELLCHVGIDELIVFPATQRGGEPVIHLSTRLLSRRVCVEQSAGLAVRTEPSLIAFRCQRELQ